MKMQVILISKEYFSILCTRPWHHSEDSASACQGIFSSFFNVLYFIYAFFN